MRKITGLIGSYTCYWIGDVFCRLVHWRVKEEFVFDRKPLQGIGMFLASNYQRFMGWSSDMQQWAGNNKPWVKVQQYEEEDI